jgi:hypothetical protein
MILYIVQCTKQSYGSVLCGFFVCEYLRMCTRFSSSWRQLKKAQGWWKKEKVDKSFKQTVADIRKFVHEAALEGKAFFDTDGDLATNPGYQKIRNWATQLHIKDYVLPTLDDM